MFQSMSKKAPKHKKRKARHLKIFIYRKKKLPRIAEKFTSFRVHLIDLIYDTQNTIRELHPEKRRRIYKSIKVLVSEPH